MEIDHKCDSECVHTEKYPPEDQVGSYRWCVLECLEGFDRDDRQPSGVVSGTPDKMVKLLSRILFILLFRGW